jgi:hypothetical protein
VSLEIPTLEMDSPFSIGRGEKETNANGNIRGNVVGQSTRKKQTKLLDRGRVVDYVG